jgi:hypothetical protein
LQHGFGDLVVAIQRLTHRDRIRASFSSSLNMRSSMPARGGGAPYSAAERARNAGARAREGALKIYSRIAYRRQFDMGA